MSYKTIKKDKYLFFSFGCCFLIAFISLSPFLAMDGGVLTICGDFHEQQIPFAIAANNAIKKGAFGWQWNAGAGTSFINAYSFYLLGSPFFWLSVIFPADLFPHLIGWIYMLKYAVAGTTAYLFIKRFVKDPRCAVLGAVLYSFSGFQASNLIFYHFHEVVAFFPLILIGLEKLITEKKKGYFAAAVALNGIVNYFFFPGEVMFCILYFICRKYGEYGEEGCKYNWIKHITMALREGIIGTMIASIMLLPNFAALLGNPRLNNGLNGESSLVSSTVKYLNILKGLMLPAEDMAAPSIEAGASQWDSVYAWLPAAGIVLVIAYIRKKKEWERSLLICSMLISLFPILGSAFYFFSSTYMRWWYMPILIMSLCCARLLDDKEHYPMVSSAVISISTVIIFAAYMFFIPWAEDKLCGIEDMRKFMVGITISIVSALIIVICGIEKIKKYFFKVFAGLAVITAVLQILLCIGYYRESNLLNADEWENEYETSAMLKTYDNNYRYAGWDNLNCYIGGVSQCGSFSSLASRGMNELYDAFGRSRDTEDSLNIPGVTAWLGGRYITSETVPEGYEVAVFDHITNGKLDKFIYETYACPIAHYYDSYILRSEFDSLNDDAKGILLTYALVIDDDKIVDTKLLKHLDITLLPSDADTALYYGIMDSEQKKLDISELSDSGFTVKGSFQDNTYAFVAVPADDGWSAYVDGKQTKILDVCGMMAVAVDGNTQKVEFAYTTPGIWQAAIISIVGLFLMMLELKKRKKACI